MVTTIPKRPLPTGRTLHDGKIVDWHTEYALRKAERILGYKLSITQGSFSTSVKQSGGTHAGGGAVDLKSWDSENKIKALRRSGFAAWVRSPSEGDWPEHIHAILVNDVLLSPTAKDQVLSFEAGRNGLVNQFPDRWAGLKFVEFKWPFSGPVGNLRWVLLNSSPDRRKKLIEEAEALIHPRS